MLIKADDVRRAFKKLSDEYARVAREISGVPGLAIGVVYLGDTLYKDTYCAGVRSIANGGKVDSDTLFQLASVSKPISSTVVAAQIARYEVAWADPVTKLDPSFPLSNPGITLESLLAHRSGLPDHAGDLLEDVGYTRSEVLARLKQLPLVPPDEKAARYSAGFAYTNFGFTLGACAAARVAGSTWEDLAMTELRRLGMGATCVTHQQLTQVENRAVLHRRDPAPISGAANPFPAVERWILSARNPDAQAPAGGIACSVTDLIAWMRVHLDAYGRTDDRFHAALRYTHEPYLPDAGYGLGWNCGTRNGVTRIGHSGGFALGAATAVSLVPKAGLGVAVLTNSQALGVPEALSAAFLMELGLTNAEPFERLLQKIGKDMQDHIYPRPEFDYSDRPKLPRLSRPLTAYMGRYSHDFYGPVTVRQEGDTLSVRLCSIECALSHWDDDTFTYLPPGENGGILSGITFGASADKVMDLRDTHLFEPYALGEPPSTRDTADTWPGVYTMDRRLRIPARGVIRKFSFYAKYRHPLRLVIYRQCDSQSPYVKCGETELVTPTEGVNEYYANNLLVEPGDFVGFHQPEAGALAFHLDERETDRGRGNLTGPVLFTATRASEPGKFEYSSARRYSLTIEFAWGLRGSGHATRF